MHKQKDPNMVTIDYSSNKVASYVVTSSSHIQAQTHTHAHAHTQTQGYMLSFSVFKKGYSISIHIVGRMLLDSRVKCNPAKRKSWLSG